MTADPAVSSAPLALLVDPPPREIAVVMMSALGDSVHVLPVLNALRRRWPEARITWVVQPLPYALHYNHPAVDSFVVFRRRRGLSGVRSFVEVRRELRRRCFDLLLDLQVYLKAGLVTALADARVKLGFDRARARDLNWLFTTHRIPPHDPQHVQDHYFEFLRALGVDPEPVEWRVVITEEERARQRHFFEALDRPACAVVLGSTSPKRNWPPDRYARLVEALDSDFGFRPVLVGGPSPGERQVADRVIRSARARAVDALGDDVRRLLWLLDGSRLVVSPDTGPLHIARALDVPVVGLYGYTNPKRAGPYRKYGDLVVDGYARWPGEEYDASPRYRPDGMERVTVERVLEKVELAVRRYVPGRRPPD